ncbi:ATPase, T2SS/T4P/T4SS family [Planctomycetota bacterium]
MNIVTNEEAIIDLVCQHEEELQHLYEAYARCVPAQADFWLAIAASEAGHSKAMKQIQVYARDGVVLVPDPEKAKSVFTKALGHVRLSAEETELHGVSPSIALLTAQQIEVSIVERKFFVFFETSEQHPADLLNRIMDESAEHAHMIAQMIRERTKYSTLVDDGVISQDDLEMAARIGKDEGVSTERMLVERFGVSREDILRRIAAHYRMEAFDVSDFDVLPDSMRKTVWDNCEQMKADLFVPVGKDDGSILVAMADPRNVPLRDKIRSLFSKGPVEFKVGIEDDIIAVIDQVCSEAHSGRASVSDVLSELEESDAAGKQMTVPVEREVSEDDSAIVKLVNLIVEEAYARGASDIHVETNPASHAQVRFRVDGNLIPLMTIPQNSQNAVISRLKIMAGLDIAEKRRPQSGKIQYKRWGRLELELRVETYSTLGVMEDAVLRLLVSAKPRRMQELDMAPRNVEAATLLMEKPYGVFLCVGPTGSGKTTTLHSMLGHLNTPGRKILTVEDPIEITQPGLRQIQVNPKAGVTFASSLRSFLRSDPDVIMVGEMRDRETASTVVEASLTGHLVLSTLHTNSASETIVRLLDMGLDPYSFGDSLLGVLSQRLVRKVCPECSTKTRLGKEGVKVLETSYGMDERFGELGVAANAEVREVGEEGCKGCSGRGYLGRLALHELLVVTPDIRQMIQKHRSATEIAAVAVAEGMRTLNQDGIEKVIAGHTTLEEVKRVCSQD